MEISSTAIIAVSFNKSTFGDGRFKKGLDKLSKKYLKFKRALRFIRQRRRKLPRNISDTSAASHPNYNVLISVYTKIYYFF